MEKDVFEIVVEVYIKKEVFSQIEAHLKMLQKMKNKLETRKDSINYLKSLESELNELECSINYFKREVERILNL